MSENMNDQLYEIQKIHEFVQQQMTEEERQKLIDTPEQASEVLQVARERVALAQEDLRILERDNTERNAKRKRALTQLNLMGGIEIPSEVIPNMPCPCGSGKTYKECHGIRKGK